MSHIIEGIEDALLITAMSGYLKCFPATRYTEEDIGRFQAACIRQLERVGVVPKAEEPLGPKDGPIRTYEEYTAWVEAGRPEGDE